DEDRGTFHVMLRDDEDNGEERPTRINPDHPIVTVFAKRNSALFREAEHERDTRDAIAALTAMRAERACPVIHESQSLAILVLAPKLSSAAYYVKDIDLLCTITG